MFENKLSFLRMFLSKDGREYYVWVGQDGERVHKETIDNNIKRLWNRFEGDEEEVYEEYEVGEKEEGGDKIVWTWT